VGGAVRRRMVRIREWLLKVGEGSPYDYWIYEGRRIRYSTIVKYFYVLRKAGLIEVVREVENSRASPIKKKLYRIVPGRENDPRWFEG